MKNMRHQWIDALKGFLMILVIATHSSLSTEFPKISVILTSGYMAIFFILSGYTTKKETLGVAIKKKAKRLIIPYIFYGVVITSMFTIIGIPRGNINISEWIGLIYSRYAIFPLDSPNNTFLLGATSPLWFLTAMFVSYIWFYIYAGLNRLRKYLCIMLYFLATVILGQAKILLPWSLDTSFLCALFIIVGYEFSSFATRIHKKGVVYFSTLIVLSFIYVAMVTYNGKTNLSVGLYGDHGILSIVFYFIFSVIITILYSELLKLCNDGIIIKPLAFVGKHSLRLMCIHMPLIVLFNRILAGSGNIRIFLTFILALSLSLMFSISIEKICCRFSKKYPILKYI